MEKQFETFVNGNGISRTVIRILEILGFKLVYVHFFRPGLGMRTGQIVEFELGDKPDIPPTMPLQVVLTEETASVWSCNGGTIVSVRVGSYGNGFDNIGIFVGPSGIDLEAVNLIKTAVDLRRNLCGFKELKSIVDELFGEKIA